MASTTQRNKARVSAFKLPALVQSAEGAAKEKALLREIDYLDLEVQSLEYALKEAREDVVEYRKRYKCVAWCSAGLIMAAVWLPVISKL